MYPVFTRKAPHTMKIGDSGYYAQREKERAKMENEAREYYVWCIVTTGNPPKWDLMMKDPKFAAAVKAENDRLYMEAIDELVKMRATELGILQGLEEEHERKRLALIKKLADQSADGLGGLLKDANIEIEKDVTYGKAAELQHTVKHIRKSKSRGDRLVIIGKITGAELKEKLRSASQTSKVLRKIYEQIIDEVIYGGDLMVIELDLRSYANWSKHITLWGDSESGRISKTVQMKWLMTTEVESTLKHIRVAGVQLTGLRSENPIPGGHRVISIGILSQDHPWSGLNDQTAPQLIGPILQALARGEFLNISAPDLSRHVTRIVVRTRNWTFRYLVTPDGVKLASAVNQEGQHEPVLSVPRASKHQSDEVLTGTLILKEGGFKMVRIENGGKISKPVLVFSGVSPGNGRYDITFTQDGSTVTIITCKLNVD